MNTKANNLLNQDEVIISMILNNNHEKGYSILYNKYLKQVYSQCYQFFKNQDIAEELTQDIFLKAFRNLETLHCKKAFYSWVRSIAYHYCIDYARKNTNIVFKTISIDAEPLAITYEESILDEEIESLKMNQLYTVLELLNPEDKKLLQLKYYQGLSIRQIQEITGHGASSIKMKLKRAKAKAFQYAQKLYKPFH